MPLVPLSSRKYQQGYAVKSISKSYVLKPGLSYIKPTRYESYLKAYYRAIRLGCDEALLTNQHGAVSEGSRTNLFIVKKGRLITPRLQSGCLQGIIRQVVLKGAKRLGIPVSEVKVVLKDVADCEEAFLTNSLIGIMPLTRMNGKKIGHGTMGPLTKRIHRRFLQLELRARDFA